MEELEAWCIHMPERLDREKHVEKLESEFSVKRFHAKKHKEGKRGCYESHQAVMKKSLHKPFIAVFEDDAVQVSNTWKPEVMRFLRREDWDILYLGCFPDVLRSQSHEYGNIYRVKATMTHAYIVSQLYMKEFVKRSYDGTPVDNVFRNEARAFAYLPSAFVQAETQSDIGNFSSSYPWKNIVIQACEFYAMHVGWPIYVWILLWLAFWLILNGSPLGRFCRPAGSFG
jgi:GR25 family glycosyltransferase involved in LPS biosynthesis